jgi:molecular chaperone Hsp33
MRDGDTLQRFLFEHSNVRGVFIHLNASYAAVSERYDYPLIVRQQLGEALAASALLGAIIKFSGSLIMQVQGDGPINMLVAQCNNEHHIRGLARWQEGEISSEMTSPFGNGRMVITIDSATSDERYQGIVGIEGGRLNQAIETYFAQSEQLQTRLWLAADEQQAVGMLLQHLPGADPDPDLWERIEALGATLTQNEMLSLPTEEILYRLFHEEDVRLFDAEPVSFRCSCSRDKIITMLRALGSDEAHEILEEQGKVSVDCDFCNQHYEFDSVDVGEIFASATPSPGSSSTH